MGLVHPTNSVSLNQSFLSTLGKDVEPERERGPQFPKDEAPDYFPLEVGYIQMYCTYLRHG